MTEQNEELTNLSNVERRIAGYLGGEAAGAPAPADVWRRLNARIDAEGDRPSWLQRLFGRPLLAVAASVALLLAVSGTWAATALFDDNGALISNDGTLALVSNQGGRRLAGRVRPGGDGNRRYAQICQCGFSVNPGARGAHPNARAEQYRQCLNLGHRDLPPRLGPKITRVRPAFS